MLDGQRYFAEFPDEQAPPAPAARDNVRDALAKLAALERELARFLRDALDADSRG
jgi:hypothetical protein